jgi:hypothetical protein
MLRALTGPHAKLLSRVHSATRSMASTSRSEPSVRCTVRSKDDTGRRAARSYSRCVHHTSIRQVFLISVVMTGVGIVIFETDPSPIPEVPAALKRSLAGLLVEACGLARVQPPPAGGHTDSRHDGQADACRSFHTTPRRSPLESAPAQNIPPPLPLPARHCEREIFGTGRPEFVGERAGIPAR